MVETLNGFDILVDVVWLAVGVIIVVKVEVIDEVLLGNGVVVVIEFDILNVADIKFEGLIKIFFVELEVKFIVVCEGVVVLEIEVVVVNTNDILAVVVVEVVLEIKLENEIVIGLVLGIIIEEVNEVV